MAAVVAGSLLAGCSSVPSMSSFSSLFGSGSSAADSNASAAYVPPSDFTCPDVAIRQGASTMTSSANPAEPGPLNTRYQVGIGTTARECRLVGTMVTMKVGMQGRVVIGPAGTPGTVDVPLRIAVVREGVTPRTITTKLIHVAVTVPPGDNNVLFSHVEEDVSFPMPSVAEIDAYIVYIGFDPLGARELEKKKPAPKRSRPRSQA